MTNQEIQIGEIIFVRVFTQKEYPGIVHTWAGTYQELRKEAEGIYLQTQPDSIIGRPLTFTSKALNFSTARKMPW